MRSLQDSAALTDNVWKGGNLGGLKLSGSLHAQKLPCWSDSVESLIGMMTTLAIKMPLVTS